MISLFFVSFNFRSKLTTRSCLKVSSLLDNIYTSVKLFSVAFQCMTKGESLRKLAHAIYRNFLVVKMRIFTGKILIFFLFLLKT